MHASVLEPARGIRERLAGHIASSELDIPVLPAVAQEALAMLGDASCDARRLSTLIHRDPTLAAHLLRVASSPYYQRGAKIVSLHQALSRLGVRTVGEIVFAICAKASTFRVRGLEAEVNALFDHSYVTAFVGRSIAKMRRLSVEDAFLGGLLHDLGRVALLQSIAPEYQHAGAEERRRMLDACDELHGEAGGAVGDAWKLPQPIREAMRHHHQPEEAAVAKPLAHLVAVADRIAHVRAETPERGVEAVLDHPSVGALNLYVEDLQALWSEHDAIRQAMKVMT